MELKTMIKLIELLRQPPSSKYEKKLKKIRQKSGKNTVNILQKCNHLYLNLKLNTNQNIYKSLISNST